MSQFLKISFAIFFVVILFSIFYFLFSGSVVFAQDVQGNGGLVPCGYEGGPDCDSICYFFALGQNIFNFLILIAIALAALSLVIGGILWVFTGFSQKMHEQGKEVVLAALWGIVIVFSSWLIINTIINFFGNPAVFTAPWNDLKCTIIDETTPVVSPGSTNTSTPSGVTCAGISCVGTCSLTSAQNQLIDTYAGMYGLSGKGNIIRALIKRESDCNSNAFKVIGNTVSCGLMQVLYTQGTTCPQSLLEDATNLEKGIQILANKYNSVSGYNYQGFTQDQLALAAYNCCTNGQNPNAQSVDCTAATGYPDPIPKWACPINPGSGEFNMIDVKNYACSISACGP